MNLYYHNKKDERGRHIKYFSNSDVFNVDEAYATVSNKNTLRGFHVSYTQDKIVQLLSGKARFIILREQEDSLNIEYIETSVNEEDCKPIYVPKGCLLGYLALEDNTVVSYLAQGEYDPERDIAYHYSSVKLVDKDMIPEDVWGIEDINSIIMSDRDKNATVYISDDECASAGQEELKGE